MSNKLMDAAFAHVKAQSDLNEDGKVDKADFELLAALSKAKAEEEAQQFVGMIGEAIVKPNAATKVIAWVASSFIFGVVLTAWVMW